MADIIEWARTAPADDFWITAAVLVGLTIAGFIGAFYYFLRKRIIEDTPTSRIRSAAQGYVELTGIGKLMEGPPIIAPLTGTPCTWYSYEIEERRRSRRRTRWVTIDRGTSEELFLLEDETGTCVIDPEWAGVTPAARDIWYGSTARPSGGPGSGRRWFSGGRYRYTEQRLHPGEPLFAIGLFETVGGAGGHFNVDGDVRTLLREWKRDSEQLLEKFDYNRDGDIDVREWEAVRQQALREVMARHAERKTVEPMNLMTATHDRRRPYILSAVPQDHLVRRFHHYSIGLILLFFAAGTASTWIIGLRLGW